MHEPCGRYGGYGINHVQRQSASQFHLKRQRPPVEAGTNGGGGEPQKKRPAFCRLAIRSLGCASVFSGWLAALAGLVQLPGSRQVAQADKDQVSTHLEPAPERNQLGA